MRTPVRCVHRDYQVRVSHRSDKPEEDARWGPRLPKLSLAGSRGNGLCRGGIKFQRQHWGDSRAVFSPAGENIFDFEQKSLIFRAFFAQNQKNFPLRG